MIMMKETKRNSTVVAMILTQLVLLLLRFKSSESAKNNIIVLPGCPESCGGIPIPYPFGIGPTCSMSEEFNVTCKIFNNGTSIPYLFGYYLDNGSSNTSSRSGNFLEILNISISCGQAHISSPVSGQCYDKYGLWTYSSLWKMNFANTPFRYNPEKNKFVVIGCDTIAKVKFNYYSNYSECDASCSSPESLTNGSCSGIGCRRIAIPQGTSFLEVWFEKFSNDSAIIAQVNNFSRCSYAMVVEETQFNFHTTYVTTDELLDRTMPIVLDWAIGNTTCEDAQTNKSSYACISSNSICLNSDSGGGGYGRGYLCNCTDGYEGNPYLPGGCQDIDECAHQNPCPKPGKCHNFEGGYGCSCPLGWHSKHRECQLNVALVIGTGGAGIVALSFLAVGIYVVFERRNLSKLKEKYFQQHGGWILLEKIKSNQGFGFTIFTKQQVEQATNNFNSKNILGHGGQGTVYRGTLRDETVAIKKCKIIDEIKKKVFGKEMIILLQINHKNIVKLLGCCLEVEVPMLVYEFIPNGTLYHHIHYQKQGSHISFATRLRIAYESAEALAYLHTSASPPIFHGDVKSANILLDHNYTAKVSDFGASILAPTDESQFVTLVQGTPGYLDPEYVQSCQLTSKSDVYSFGVVLLELLTSKPVIDFDAPEEDRSLSSRFISAMEEKKIHELLDDQIRCEGDMELITQVAELAVQCLNMKGNERPMMKKVAEELDRISKLNQHPGRQEYHHQDRETLLSEASHDVEIENTTGSFSLEMKSEKSIAAR